MSLLGQSRHSACAPMTSGVPPEADIFSVRRALAGLRCSPRSGHCQCPSACPKRANKRHQGSITLLAIAASAGELIFTARYEYLETVKHSLAYWTLKVPIGTAAAKRLLDGTSNGSRIEPAYPKRPARPMEALKGLALLSRGRAVNETRRTEIPSSSGMGSLASNSAY